MSQTMISEYMLKLIDKEVIKKFASENLLIENKYNDDEYKERN